MKIGQEVSLRSGNSATLLVNDEGEQGVEFKDEPSAEDEKEFRLWLAVWIWVDENIERHPDDPRLIRIKAET